MKFILCLTFLASVAFASVMGMAGQSACRDPSEVGQTFPHHWDPSKYWYCERLNENAVEKMCPKDTAYMHLLKECIPWPNWIWKKPVNPPTVPEDEVVSTDATLTENQTPAPESQSSAPKSQTPAPESQSSAPKSQTPAPESQSSTSQD